MTPLQGTLGSKGAGRCAQIQANAYTNAAASPETLASWFTRLERRANQLIDAGEFMDTVEWMRWREELDRWQDGR